MNKTEERFPVCAVVCTSCSQKPTGAEDPWCFHVISTPCGCPFTVRTTLRCASAPFLGAVPREWGTFHLAHGGLPTTLPLPPAPAACVPDPDRSLSAAPRPRSPSQGPGQPPVTGGDAVLVVCFILLFLLLSNVCSVSTKSSRTQLREVNRKCLPPPLQILFPRDDSSSQLGMSDAYGVLHVSENACVPMSVCIPMPHTHTHTHFLF